MVWKKHTLTTDDGITWYHDHGGHSRPRPTGFTRSDAEPVAAVLGLASITLFFGWIHWLILTH
jgi:hypothetical protein